MATSYLEFWSTHPEKCKVPSVSAAFDLMPQSLFGGKVSLGEEEETSVTLSSYLARQESGSENCVDAALG